MATKNLSEYDINSVPDGRDLKFGIVVFGMELRSNRGISEWSC